MLINCDRYEPFCMLSLSLSSRNCRSSPFGRRISQDIMVSSIRRKHFRRRSRAPKSDSDVAFTSSGSGCHACSNPTGFRFGFPESSQNPILNKFRNLNLEKDTEFVSKDPEDEVLAILMNDIKNLELQVQERKKWATEKVVQAEKRLRDETNELQKLRKERETEGIKQVKSTLDVDHPIMKNLISVELAFRTSRDQLYRTHLIKIHCELANMHIRTNIAAVKLSTSESVTASAEAAKKEKKHLKKVLAWKKQRIKLQNDIASEKKKLIEMQEEMILTEAARKTAEAKFREVQESQKQVLVRIKQERRLKEQTVSNNKRSHKSLCAKIDLDLKRHKDDIQRLKQELSHVKSLADKDHDFTDLFGPHFEDDFIGKLLHGSGDEDDDEDDMIDNECVMCAQNEVAVVFLPCAHEVVCVDCNEELKKDECPTCGVVIEQRIRVFGGSC